MTTTNGPKARTYSYEEGDEVVRYGEPIGLTTQRRSGRSEWMLVVQLDKQKIFVGLRDVESVRRLGEMVERVLGTASTKSEKST